MSSLVTVIIPTLANDARAASLMRAIESVMTQRGVEPRILVVINGNHFDYKVRTRLESDSRLCVHYEAIGSLPKAIQVGRAHSSSDFFCFLDDDDEFVPNSLAKRLSIAQSKPECDFLAFNGYYREAEEGGLRTYFTDFDIDPHALFETLLQMNWLASCGGLFRADRVNCEIFRDLPKYFEWTTVAFRLMAKGLKGELIDEPAFIVNETPNSLSRTDAFIEAAPRALLQLLELPMPGSVRRGVRKKLGDAYHDLSELALNNGDKRLARHFHYRCIFSGPSALRRYALYARRLF